MNFLENVYLYNIDDLQAIADDYLKQRKEEIVRCEQIIAEKVKPLLETTIFNHRWTRMNAGHLPSFLFICGNLCKSVAKDMPAEKPIIIATRGSALALAQANFIAGQCRESFPAPALRVENHQNDRR